MSWYDTKLGRREHFLSKRLEELQSRLEELMEVLPSDPLSADYDRCFYSQSAAENNDYVLPEHLSTVQDVLYAIQRAEDKLWDVRCEARLAEQKPVSNVIPGQITLFGYADGVTEELMPLAS